MRPGLGLSVGPVSSAARVGRRSLTTTTVNPANASKITANAQNTWLRLAAASRGSARLRLASEEGAATLHEQRVEGLLDRLTHLIDDVEHDHRVVDDTGTEFVWMIHLLGSGIMPSGPNHGNSGVIGKYGTPSARASAGALAISG